MAAEVRDRQIMGMNWNIFFTGLTSFLTDTSVKMVYAVMPLFLLSIGATKTELSFIEGVAESTAALIKAFSGWWSDKIGRNKPFMIIGYAVTAAVTPLYSLVVSPLQVLFLRFIERTGKGVRTAPRDSLIAGSAETRKVGKGFGFHKAMDNAGAIIGPLLACLVLLVYPDDYRRIFLMAAIPALIGVGTIILFIKEAGRKKEELPARISLREFSWRYYAFLVITIIFTLGNSTDALLLVKAQSVGIQVAAIPLVYMLFNIVSVLLSVPMGTLSDRIGRERLIIFGLLVYSLVYYGFGKSGDKLVILLLFALYGVYSAATDGVQKALVSDLVVEEKRGTALGIYNAILGITLLPASLMAGVLYDRTGAAAAFYFGALMAFIGAVLMLVFEQTKKRSVAGRS